MAVKIEPPSTDVRSATQPCPVLRGYYQKFNRLAANQIPVMVEFIFPTEWPAALLELLPLQREIVDKLLARGHILSYSLAMDRSRVWMVFVADNADDAIAEMVADWPIIDYVTYRTTPLMFTNDSSSVFHYSLN